MLTNRGLASCATNRISLRWSPGGFSKCHNRRPLEFFEINRYYRDDFAWDHSGSMTPQTSKLRNQDGSIKWTILHFRVDLDSSNNFNISQPIFGQHINHHGLAQCPSRCRRGHLLLHACADSACWNRAQPANQRQGHP